MKQTLVVLLAFGLTLLALSAAAPARADVNLPNPILFVTQVPTPFDYTTVGSTIGNQRGDLDAAPRGGDLYIRYPDGTLKNLTQAAGYGSTGANGFQDQNAIAVRDPAMYWDGTKAIFSMVIGAPTAQYQVNEYRWQLYEITGLGKDDTPIITKVPNQPANYNNISPTYGTDDRILFTSDRPRSGDQWLYPQLDEYESAATVTGIWSLDPQSGDLFLLTHSPSGAFTPFVDSFGRVIFTRWDHLQRDQQADSDHEKNAGFSGAKNCPAYCTFNYADESQNAARLALRDEIFPEPRPGRSDLLNGTKLVGHTFNDFAPWQITEDGMQEETLNHIGRHELLRYINRSIKDPALEEYYGQYPRTNPNAVENFLQIKEDPTQAGRYFGIDAPEFFTHGAGQVISINGAPNVNPDQMVITYWTHRDTASFTDNPSADFSGHYRDILPLANGTLVAAVSAYPGQDKDPNPNNNQLESLYDFRLKTLAPLPNGYVGGDQTLTAGINKTVSWWDPDKLMTFSGALWEWQPVEVRARPRPPRLGSSLPSIEANVFAQAGVNLTAFQDYLRQNNLALLVSRNVTQRDDQDHQQPFNLRVPNGVQTLSLNYKTGDKIYDEKYMQLFQADQVRGMGGTKQPGVGRRVIAQYLHDSAAANANPRLPNAPAASVEVAPDGSVAAFVPARRAVTWQTTDASGSGVVRERMWVTFQPGEIRVCTSCHGVNDKDQAGNGFATNSPQALLEILEHWKANNGNFCATKPDKPALISPLNNATLKTRQVTLDWNDVPCATKYKLQVREGTPQGAMAYKNKNVTASYQTKVDVDKGKTYVWRVTACNPPNGCNKSAWFTFRIQ